MSSHRPSRRQPRAHWLLLTLSLLVLLAELVFNGIITNAGGEDGQLATETSNESVVPAAALEGGPVLRIDGESVSTRSMPAKTVALTFDDGPDPTWTPRILDVLKAHNAKATFFVVGSRVNAYPDLVRRIVAEGHELGVHTFTHHRLDGSPVWRQDLEVSLTVNAIASVTGRGVTLLRPPYSSEPDAITPAEYAAQVRVAQAGFLIVLTDHDTRDWSNPGVDKIVASALPAKGQGGVVMMHDGGGDRTQTVAALSKMLDEYDRLKYRATTVSDGLGLIPPPAATNATSVRGDAMRVVQNIGSWLSSAMTVLLAIAVVLAAVRLITQIVTSIVHRRRARQREDDGLFYLGPVTVIVPAYNESANIAATVRSLIANDYPHVEVIVVDDGSTDGTAEIVSRMGLPQVRVIRQANAGKPAALNNGLDYVRTGIVIMVDGDTVFEPTAIGQLVQPLRDETVGAVSGNTKVANRDGLLGRWQHLEYVMGFNLDRRMFEVGECMPTVPGAIGAFRMDALAEIGGVPDLTLAEDTDLTMALIRAGWRVVYEQTAIAWTEAPATIGQLWKQRYRWCFGTMQAMWRHRRAVLDRGASGRLGRRGLGYLAAFQIALPLCAPAVDIYALYGLLFLPLSTVVAVWVGFLGAQMLTAAYALRMDRESLGVLWTLPLQQIVYRQLMYLVVIQSTVSALTGIRLRWHRIARTGQAEEALITR